MSAEELYRKIKSEMLFNRAVMSVMAALFVSRVGGGETKDAFWCLVLYGVYSLARSLEEWVRGSDE